MIIIQTNSKNLPNTTNLSIFIHLFLLKFIVCSQTATCQYGGCSS